MSDATLYIVATPIGNLQDITLRALATLKSVDKIYCEDTRRTRQLLSHYQIHQPVDSLHHYSSNQKIERVVEELKQGQDIAYLTDAGTPGIADPGGILIAKARAAGIRVVPIPGPSAPAALLSVAGFPVNSFFFAGYVPTKKGRQTFIKKILVSEETVVLFETAPRLLKFLDQLMEFGGNEREIVIGRELTKQFEDIRSGLPGELRVYYQTNRPKGELVIALKQSEA